MSDTNQKHCRVCNCVLIVRNNWRVSRRNIGNYLCDNCDRIYKEDLKQRKDHAILTKANTKELTERLASKVVSPVDDPHTSSIRRGGGRVISDMDLPARVSHNPPLSDMHVGSRVDSCAMKDAAGIPPHPLVTSTERIPGERKVCESSIPLKRKQEVISAIASKNPAELKVYLESKLVDLEAELELYRSVCNFLMT